MSLGIGSSQFLKKMNDSSFDQTFVIMNQQSFVSDNSLFAVSREQQMHQIMPPNPPLALRPIDNLDGWLGR